MSNVALQQVSSKTGRDRPGSLQRLEDMSAYFLRANLAAQEGHPVHEESIPLPWGLVIVTGATIVRSILSHSPRQQIISQPKEYRSGLVISTDFLKGEGVQAPTGQIPNKTILLQLKSRQITKSSVSQAGDAFPKEALPPTVLLLSKHGIVP